MSYSGSEKNTSFFESLVHVGRCSKVVAGGRRFRFSAIVVVGDKKGKFGMGVGKANEVVDAKAKAAKNAKNNLMKINLKDGRTIYHDIEAKFCAGRVLLKTAPSGTGIIAGGPMRSLMDVIGIKDIVSKSLGSSNPYSVLYATLKAFSMIKTPREIASNRGCSVKSLFESEAV